MVAKITHRDVVEYLKSLAPDMRVLVLDLAAKEVAEADKKKAELSARLAKARKAKDKKHGHAGQAAAGQAQRRTGLQEGPHGVEVQADPAVQAEVAEQLPTDNPNNRQIAQQRRRSREAVAS